MKTLILGQITFFDPVVDGVRKAIVHKIDTVVHCENAGRAETLGEESLKSFDAYLIPSEYRGEIVYECPKPETIL